MLEKAGFKVVAATIDGLPIKGYRNVYARFEVIGCVSRFTFGSMDLWHGLELTPVVVGLFGIAEVLIAAEEK